MENEAREKQTFDVLLSHNNQDKSIVRELKQLLGDHGLRAWLDESELVPGRVWMPSLTQAIMNSTTLAVCIGPAGIGPWQDEEMQYVLNLAVKDGRPVIPLLLPGAPEKPEVLAFLTTRTWVDLRRGLSKEGIARVVWGITGRKPASLEISSQGTHVQTERAKGSCIFRHAPEKLVGRECELATLDRLWNTASIRVLTIVAWGGVGKTSLVAHWMVARDVWNRPDFERVFDWSFYSQGTREQGAVTADPFIADALEFFGGDDGRKLVASAMSSRDKGAKLAQFIAQRRTLLVLDGVEPLQYPPGPRGGRSKDPALEALLIGLAQHNPGLCIVTTREPATDLAPFRGTVSPEWRLEHLSTDAGAELLFQMGVDRAGDREITANDQELRDAADEVCGHALTLRLLGRYLAKGHNGDVQKRHLVRFEKADEMTEGGHTFKVMAAYEKWLAGGEEEGKRQLAVLYLLGLFDRPAEPSCLAALRSKPVLEGLTEPLVGLGDDDWNYTLASLAECGLISCRESQAGSPSLQPTIDCHPLIREYFGARLRERNPRAWRAAHRRLYEHLRKKVADPRPPTLEKLRPLCDAVAHACEAGLAAEACEELYRQRIVRDQKDYLSSHLGGAVIEERLLDMLGAERGFLDFAEEDRAFLYRQWGLTLRKLGKVKRAVPAFIAAAKSYVAVENWDRAVNANRHLALSYLLAGDLEAAGQSARDAVRLAQKRVTAPERTAATAAWAHILHQRGDNAQAKKRFEIAESESVCGRSRFLHGHPGVRYCDLLLDPVERAAWRQMLRVKTSSKTGSLMNLIACCREVEGRSREAMARSRSRGIRVGTGLNLLSLGRAVFCRALLMIDHPEAGPLLESACRYVDEAVSELQHAGEMDFQPDAFLVRAWCSFVRAQGCDSQGEHDQAAVCRASAKSDLDSAWQIVERGPMRPHMIDIRLYRARLFHEVKPYPWAEDGHAQPLEPKDDLAFARRLMEQCGYHRRQIELQDAEEAATSW